MQELGLDKAIETAKLFGFSDSDLPRSLSLALGSGAATPLKMAQVYAVFANGGFRVEPYLIERIETPDGGVVFQATPPTACPLCDDGENGVPNPAPRVLTPKTHFLMNSMLQDVVRYGTATKALELGRSDLAGKTGTTNEQRDAWFDGYAPAGIPIKKERPRAEQVGPPNPAGEIEELPDHRSTGLVAVSWLGFDTPKPLGEGETGGHTALPMWMYYMQEALKEVPEATFLMPDGLVETRIGTISSAKSKGGAAISEYYSPDQVPKPSPAPAKKRVKRARPGSAGEDTYSGGQSDEDFSPRDSGGSSGRSAEPLF
jgi:penicillin-binding protein 1A